MLDHKSVRQLKIVKFKMNSRIEQHKCASRHLVFLRKFKYLFKKSKISIKNLFKIKPKIELANIDRQQNVIEKKS